MQGGFLDGAGDLLLGQGLVLGVVRKVLLRQLLAQEFAAGGLQDILNKQDQGIRHRHVQAAGILQLGGCLIIGHILVGLDIQQLVHGDDLQELIGELVEVLLHSLCVGAVGQELPDRVHFFQNRLAVDVLVFHVGVVHIGVGLVGEEIGFPDSALRCQRRRAQGQHKGEDQQQGQKFLSHSCFLILS